MKIIIDSQDKISSMAASMIAEHAKAKPGCAMAFAAGRTTKKVYDALTAMNVKELAGCKAFTVCEYEGLEDARSCAYRLNEELYSKAGITQIFTPNAENADKFDAEIEKCGGIELAVLGIGTNGHIGFNEPSDSFVKNTNKVKLTDSTIDANQRFFEKREDVPTHAYTMGIGGIMKAKRVLLVVNGANKAQAVKDCFFGPIKPQAPGSGLAKAKAVKAVVSGPVTPECPGSILQLHPDFTLVADEAALSLVKDLL